MTPPGGNRWVVEQAGRADETQPLKPAGWDTPLPERAAAACAMLWAMARKPTPREVARHIGSLARHLVRRPSHERADNDALAELTDRPLGLPDGLDVEWLGVAGYRVTHEGSTLLIDPYLTRAPLSGVVRRQVVRADPGLHARLLDPYVGTVEGILVGHTHFDHAIDVPALARRYGTKAYGSRSLVQLMRIHGLGCSAVQVIPRKEIELGPFRVQFVPSLHSPLILGFGVPSAGELTCEHLDGLTPSSYRCGDVYGIRIEVAGAVLYHQGSANLIDDEVPRGGVDVFLAGIAGRRFTPGYWERILPRLDPRVVACSHYDDFFRAADAEQGLSLNVNVAGVPDEVASVSGDITVAAIARRSVPLAG